MIQEPIEKDSDGWWFWEENWAIRHGPYNTREEAVKKLTEYCQTTLGNEDVRETHSFSGD